MARALTKLQLEFCKEYVSCFDGTEAMVRARKTCGVKGNRKSARVTASKWLTKANIREANRQLSREAFVESGIDPAAVLQGVYEIAFSDPRQVFDGNGAMLPVRELPAGVARSISSIEVDELFAGAGEEKLLVGHTKKIKFWPKNDAFRMLGEHLKLWKGDKDGGVSGAPVNITITTGEAGTPGSMAPAPTGAPQLKGRE